jgi:hypothetical protein
VIPAVLAFSFVGCSNNAASPTLPLERAGGRLDARAAGGTSVAAGVSIADQDGSVVPTDLRDIEFYGEPFTFWPYTGAALDGYRAIR